MNSTQIPLAGVIGSPIAHSKSPRLHQHWLNRYGILGHYIPMEVRADDLEYVLNALPKMGFIGVNVTIPHKEHVLSLADAVTDSASLIGSANTLTFRPDGKLYADNTDAFGFMENLKQNAPDWDPKTGPAAIIGSGGAARAVISALIEAGAPEIRLSNRTKNRAEALQREFGNKVVVYDWVKAGNTLEDASLVVNASSLGMQGKPEMRVPLDALSKHAVVTDLVYAPLETPLLSFAKSIGCVTVDGLGMLLHQAAPGFERWFSKKPEVDEELRQALLL